MTSEEKGSEDGHSASEFVEMSVCLREREGEKW